MTQDEAIKAHSEAVLAADVALYQAGVASVTVTQTGISADQEAADIAAAVSALKAQIDDLTSKVAADDASLLALQSKLDQIKALLA